ncbi:hypothetical protein OJ997_00425 [Solirubrobacter phytolaccae]|uniref:Uncharacterized protein n=1 Tax=Solirubrobacter phytolaccae TaxID=1404360 RepID=A0A9X3S673_9ACTN|nr:hypothetical protein [Solirubrobacter phytolaccae]MDA0178743.1 hypothetical protein [Solirubrobacter phytolaccae]
MSAADDPRAAQNSIRDQLVAAAHREPDPSRTAQTALRDALVAAGVREHESAVAAHRGRRRRRHRRTAGFAVLALLGATAVAEGTGLISVGEPIKPAPGLEASDPKITAANGERMDIVATAPDEQRNVSYGLATYTSAAGNDCVIAGQLRGNQLGLERYGTFHRFSDLRPGVCVEDGGQRTNDLVNVDSDPPRTLLYGITTPDKPGTVTLRATGEKRAIDPVDGGAWLLVYEGRLTVADFKLERP